MLSVRMYDFVHEERGGGTIMGLFWFMILVSITGLAVDTTNGFRNRTMLQATADAAALAAVIDLPNTDDAVISAVDSSVINMPDDMYGEVLKTNEVYTGAFHLDDRSFEDNGVVPDPLNPGSGIMFPDSVRVVMHQTSANANAVPVNFLRIIGLKSWDVNVEAVAQRFIPDCLNDGLIARGIVDISSNNGFVNNICIHGQQGVDMSSNNFYELGVNVSMPNLSEDLSIPASGMTSNIGLPDALREQSLDPRMVNHIDEIIADILALEPDVMPDYIDLSGGGDGGGGCVGFVCGTTTSAPLEIQVRDERWDFADAEAGNVYHIQCRPNKVVGIPQNITLDQMVIIADCNVNVGSNVTMTDVILASRSGGNAGIGVLDDNMTFSSGVNLGANDNCAVGGGVQVFSNASIHFSSTMSLNGVQIVAAGDVELGARDMGINGINVQSGADISLTSNNMFGLCSGNAPNLQTVAYYRLVH